MLMQMQNSGNDTLQAVDLDQIHDQQKHQEPPEAPPDVVEQAALVSTMDWETAKELDDAVTVLSTDNAIADVKVLPLNSLYQSLQQTPRLPDLALSRPEHYRERIGRDMRHLAVSIAASTESPTQWRLFCQENGGLYPLLETVREGARSIAEQSLELWLGGQAEESFLAACNACRALRDVCAVSPEVAAVVTDGILRANAAWGGGLLHDFESLLAYASSERTAPKEKAGFIARRRGRKEARYRCQLYVNQLLLAMTFASDDAITAIRQTDGLAGAIVASSSYARKEKRRRWLRYPGELAKFLWRSRRDKNADRLRRPFLEAANIGDDLKGQVQKTANLVLAGIGHNQWVPKIPGQRGLRILCLDGGGSRGMAAISAVKCLMDYIGNGADVADSFDMIAGTSTGGIIAFLTGLRRETSAQALERYNQLIKQIFVKSALSTTRMVFTTASYDESHFMSILSSILKDETMLDSRTDPTTPYVFCVSSKMSSTPTHVSLFRNYNYPKGELADHFTIDPAKAREELGLPLELENELVRRGQYLRKEVSTGSPGVRVGDGSRHPGSFRVLQRYALRASTAAPTVFKPVMMGGEMYCDGGIVASNPTAVAIHEARTLFPDIPIEMVVSVGTGGFLEQKSSPRIGWDGIIAQIVGSACDGEQIHHILEDILGESSVLGHKSVVSKTRYFRFNPVLGLPVEFPIDVTEPDKLVKLKRITEDYMNEPAQKAKMDTIADILKGRRRWRL